MAFPPDEAWILVPLLAAIGILAAVLTMASAIRQGLDVARLEVRVRELRAQQRQAMIDRGLIEADPDELGTVDILDDIDEDAGDEAGADTEPTRSRAA